MSKELNLDEITEYLQLLAENVVEHDETCETCEEQRKSHYFGGCEYISTIRVEIARITHKLG